MAGVRGQRQTEPRSGRRSGRQRLWQSMRVLRSFTIHQVAATSETTWENAKHYVRRLELGGYVVKNRQRNGKAGDPNGYVLIRNSGPRSPICWKDGRVYDPNTGEVYGE